MFTIRSAKLKDCAVMAEMIKKEAKRDNMLPRTVQKIMVNLNNFLVAESGGEVIGCCAFKIWDNEWVEIISLTTLEKYREKGVGSALLTGCISQAKKLGFSKVCAVTVAPQWFAKRGFSQVPFQDLPHKVWGDCVNCPKNTGGPGEVKCNETPMILAE